MPLIRRLVSLLSILVLCLAVAPGARAAKDDLVIGITQFPSTFHPSIESMLAKTYILSMALRPVTAYDKEWRLVCMLCTELPTLENGLAVPEDLPEGRRGVALTFTLNAKATWGDGVPVTSHDVVFTWEVGRNPKSGLGDVELYRRITAIDIEDDKTFTIHVDRLTFDYNSFSLDILPAHLERRAFEENPAEYRNRTTYDVDTTNPGLYFGPYRVTEVSRGAHVVLEANPTWYGEKPEFRRIIVKAIENTAALEANLLSGGVDYVAGELGLTLDQALAFEKRHRDRFEVVFKPGLIYEHIDVNLDNPVLSDGRVRQALLYGLDRAAMSRQLFDDRQPVALTNVNPLDWIHADEVTRYDYDAAKAAALLDEAGWKLEGKTRRNGQGESLRIELMTTAGNRSRELVQQVIQSQWRKLGVEVGLRNEPARVFFGQTVSHRKFPHLAMFAWVSAPESVPRTTLHSESIPSEDNNWSGQNYTGYANPEMDRLIDAIEIELDKDKRRKLWHDLQRLYAEELPALPLYFRADAYVLPQWLKGVEPTGHQFVTTLWIEQWRAER